MKILSVILIVTTFIFLSSCDLFNMKHDPKLPPITTDGKNTFGCLVNGKVFLNEGSFGFGNGVYAELQFATDSIGVNLYAGNSSTQQNLILSIFDTPALQVGKIYNLNNPEFFVRYVDYSGNPPWCNYKNVISGNIKLLKFDITNAQNKIIAGTFEVTASSTDCNDTMNIKQGRFDISDFQ